MSVATVLDVKTGYDLWANQYDHDANLLVDLDEAYLNPTRCRFMAAMVANSVTNTQRTLSALDVGCGTGRHIALLERYFENVTGVDLSPEMLSRAMTKSQKLSTEFVCGDFRESLFKTRFDFIHSSLALMHFDSPANFIATASSLLKPGGLLFLADADPDRLRKGTTPNFRHLASDQIVKYQIPHLAETLSAVDRAQLEILEFGRVPVPNHFALVHLKYAKYLDQEGLFYLVARKAVS